MTTRYNEARKLLLIGQFQLGLRFMSEIVSEEGTGRYVGGRGLAHLLLGNNQEATNDFRQLRKRLNFVPILGCSLWFCGEREAACEEWSAMMLPTEADKVNCSDGAGYVQPAALLWWASAHPEQYSWRKFAERQLAALLKTDMSLQNGFGPIAFYLMSEIDEEDALFAALNQKYKVVEANQLCQTHFYIGAMHLANGNLDAYKGELQKVLDYGSKYGMPEHHLAQFELERLG